MKQPETCINQTLVIWCAVVVVEIFVLASLMNFPWIVFMAIIMFWPAKAAMNWPMEEIEEEKDKNEKSEDGKAVTAKS